MRKSSSRLLILMLILTAAALLFSACGTDPAESTTTVPTGTTAVPVLPYDGPGLVSRVFVYDGEEKSIDRLSDLPEGVTAVYRNMSATDPGVYTATVTLSKGGYTSIVLEATLTILESPLSGVTFSDATFLEDGTAHDLLISGSLPENVAVTYEGNGQFRRGTYTVTAHFAYTDSDVPLPSMTAVMTVIENPLQDISFPDAVFVANGQPHALAIAGTLPEGITVTYEGNDQSEPGKFTVRAHFAFTDETLPALPSMQATLTIIESPLKDISFSGMQVVYDGTEHRLTITGTLPDNVAVSYTGNGRTDAGTYRITAMFRYTDGTAAVLPNMEAYLVIQPAQWDFSEVRWNYTSSLIYNGMRQSVELTGLPDGLPVTYTQNSASAIGTYVATATFGEVKNYTTPSPMILSWSIIETPPEVDINGGSQTPEGEYQPEGTVVTVTADRAGIFFCWTLDTSYQNGGRVVSTDRVYTFTVTEDIRLYANYAPEGGGVVYYELGDGTGPDGEHFYFDFFSSPFYLCPNTVPDTGVFENPGHTLLEYNTEPDGSGTPVNPGGKAVLPDDRRLTLYAVWAPWSDADLFDTAENETGLTITSYRGSESTVIIPARIRGTDVTVIAEGAFIAKPFVTLSVPSTVHTVEQGAFRDCPEFDKLYLCDNIRKIYDNSFVNCRAFTQFCYNAAMAPVFSNSEGWFAKKFEMVMTETGNTLVVISGSSSLNGLDSPYLEELMGYQYNVVNLGTNAGSNGTLYHEFCSAFLEEGDIVVCAAEYNNVQYGNNNLYNGWKTFRALEHIYNVFRYVDISHYTRLFDTIRYVNTEMPGARHTLPPRSYSHYSNGVNQYGDVTGNLAHNGFTGSGNTYLSYNYLSAERAANMKRVFDLLKGNGCTVYFSCPPYLENCFNMSSDVEGYARAILEKTGVLLISDPRDYLLPYDLMYNSNYHPNQRGADKRTEQLAADLKAVLGID